MNGANKNAPSPISYIFAGTVYLLIFVLLSPWYAWRAIRRLYHLRLCFSDTLTCPAGHNSTAVHGTWACASCGAEFWGWAFRKCPCCGLSAGYVQCEEEGCGLAIRNPLYR